MNRLAVLSDLHLAPAGPLLSFRAGTELTALINGLSDDTTLVLNGDTFDLLQLNDHPGVLDLVGAPALVRRALDGIGQTPWGPELLRALGSAARRGSLVVVPGNHDPELLVPEVEGVLRDVLDAGEGLRIHREPGPLVYRLGGNEIFIGHGNRRDRYNEVDTYQVREALSQGERTVPLPPGSHLVLGPIQQAQRAQDPITGKPRFPFVDLLKPELPGVALLLLHIDPVFAAPLIWDATPHLMAAFLRGLEQRLRAGPTLAALASVLQEDLLAELVAAAATPAERGTAAGYTTSSIERHLKGVRPSAPGTLGVGGPRVLLRAALRSLSYNGTFWDRGRLGELDALIVKEHLPSDEPNRIVIAGHTHAAKEIRFDRGRVYLNTGTWSDLLDIQPMVDDGDCKRWVEQLCRGELPPRRHLTWAEVTDQGAWLREVGKEPST